MKAFVKILPWVFAQLLPSALSLYKPTSGFDPPGFPVELLTADHLPIHLIQLPKLGNQWLDLWQHQLPRFEWRRFFLNKCLSKNRQMPTNTEPTVKTPVMNILDQKPYVTKSSFSPGSPFVLCSTGRMKSQFSEQFLTVGWNVGPTIVKTLCWARILSRQEYSESHTQ